jgi:site-specific DNA recombinase
MLLAQPELIPAIGYYRVSTWHEEKISDEIQIAVIEDAARRRGRRIVHWIADLDATGRNFKRRIMDGIELVETGGMEGAREIWVWKFSRFGRSRLGVAQNLARIEQAGGELISATEDLDSGTAVGGLTRDMLFAIAAFESDRIGEQWRETHEWRRKLGLPAQGGHRFGYLWTPRLDPEGRPQEEKYEPDPASASPFATVYSRYADGDGFLPLAKWLNGQGLYNPSTLARGGWGIQALSQYMDSGFAAGLLRVHRADAKCPQRARCPLPREHYGYIPGAQPPILDDEVWLAYRERREQRKRLPPRSRIPTYPFTGIARCGICGGSAGAYKGMGVTGYGWRCTRRLNGSGACTGATVTTRLLFDTVQAWLADVEAGIDARSVGVDAEPVVVKTDTAPLRERLAMQITQAQQALDRASGQLARGLMPEDNYVRVRDELAAERARAEAELAELIAEDPAAPGEPSAGQIAVVRRLREEWDALPVPVLRDLLMSVAPVIRLWPQGHEPRIDVVPVWASLVV